MPEITSEINALVRYPCADKQLVFEQIGTNCRTIRFNPLKGDVELPKKLFAEQDSEFRTNHRTPGYLPDEIPAVSDRQKSLSHFLGHFYVQDIASMVPAILDPQPGEWVLDMSAAPGSKPPLRVR
ncbi:MAG: hypothetical protein R3C26_02470 [Calditrichia bacterium]